MLQDRLWAAAEAAPPTLQDAARKFVAACLNQDWHKELDENPNPWCLITYLHQWRRAQKAHVDASVMAMWDYLNARRQIYPDQWVVLCNMTNDHFWSMTMAYEVCCEVLKQRLVDRCFPLLRGLQASSPECRELNQLMKFLSGVETEVRRLVPQPPLPAENERDNLESLARAFPDAFLTYLEEHFSQAFLRRMAERWLRPLWVEADQQLQLRLKELHVKYVSERSNAVPDDPFFAALRQAYHPDAASTSEG